MQLIADYYSFASPTVTGQWRIQVDDQAWQIGFRGGELASVRGARADHDLLSFLHDISALSESNLSCCVHSNRSGREIDQALSEVVGGSAELLISASQACAPRDGRLLCMNATRADFSDLAPQNTTLVSTPSPCPTWRFRLQPPRAARKRRQRHARQSCYRLSRNPKVPVAGLQLDKEALRSLSVANFTTQSHSTT